MSKTDWNEDIIIKEMEDKLKENGNKNEVPESLKPETVGEMLKRVEQKNNQKKKAVKGVALAASIAVVAGTAYFAGTLSVNHNNSEKLSISKDSESGNEDSLVGTGNSDEIGAEQQEVDETETLAATADGEEDSGSIQLSEVTGSNLMGASGGSMLVKKGQYMFSVMRDNNGTQNNKIMVSKVEDGSFTVVSELMENQPVQELYLRGNVLAAIISDEQSTMIHMYNIEDMDNVVSTVTMSVGGGWESSCIQGSDLYVFTKEGSIGRAAIDPDSQSSISLQLDEKDARYFMSGNDIYTFSDQNDKITVQKYTLHDSQLEKGESCQIDGMSEDIIGVTVSEEYLKVAIGNQHRSDGAVIFYYIGEGMKTNRVLQNTRENEQDSSAQFLTNGKWKDKLISFARTTDGSGNVSNGFVLNIYQVNDSGKGETVKDSFELKDVVNSPVFYSFGTVFLDEEKERIGFDVYVEEGDSIAHKYYVVGYGESGYDVLMETDLGSSKLGQEIYAQYDGSYLYLTDEYGTVEVYK